MWWKLCGIAFVTFAAIISVIPIRTHAVLYDPAAPPPRGWTLMGMIANMYLTTGTLALIAVILIVAAWVAARVIRTS